MHSTGVLLLFHFFAGIYAHSWVACTDYRITGQTDPAASVYDATKCKAFPRNWKSCCTQGGFGLDHGYDYLPGTGNVCEQPISSPLSNNYDANSAMAAYQPGQKVCLAWPAKNHVAASCINPNIPDNGVKIWVNPNPNPTADVPKSQLVLAYDLGTNTGKDQYKGFQNCPNFCQDPDKCICTGCFIVPSNLQVGSTYTFVWQWAFNSPTDIYSNCWEALITTGTGTPPATPPATPPTPPATPPAPFTPSPPVSPPVNPPNSPTPPATPPAYPPPPPAASTSGQTPLSCGGYDVNTCTTVCGEGKVRACDCVNNQFRIQCASGSLATISVVLICLLSFLL